MRILVILFSLMATVSFAQDSWLIDKNGCKVYNPYPRKHESVEWTGECKDGTANGYGKLIWYLKGKKTNNVYTGFMKNGRPEGKGKYETQTKFFKETFEGVFQNGELSFGTIYSYSKQDTTKYVGEITNWKANGHGVMSFSDGDWFKGEFKDNYFIDGVYTVPSLGYKIESSEWKYYSTPKGTLTWGDGSVYIGELEVYLPHGNGMIVYPDGVIQKGKWRNGILIKILESDL
ncbi:hypothetical protein [Carboxylicivirga sp. RSCT41]|uniref:hypothetical protein n=1 Tax=Carboxylicivirga agarovorans TaxID=3417570 RepID=UPI003D334257